MKKKHISARFFVFSSAVLCLFVIAMPAQSAPVSNNIGNKLQLKAIPHHPGGLTKGHLFEFDVPVNLDKVHRSVKKAIIYCVVNGEHTTVEDDHNPITPHAFDKTHTTTVGGNGYSEIPLSSSGNYHGVVKVFITEMNGDPGFASNWQCGLFFPTDNDFGEPGSDPSNPALTPAPGTDFSIQVEGTITP